MRNYRETEAAVSLCGKDERYDVRGDEEWNGTGDQKGC